MMTEPINMKRVWGTVGVAMVFPLTLDPLTKVWAEQVLVRHVPIEVAGEWIRLTLAYNEGIAFGLLATKGPGVTLLSAAALLLIVFWVLRRDAALAPSPWAAGLLLGGGLANLFDRITDSRVTDFLDLGAGTHRWPTFNFADVFIVAGVVVLVAASSRRDTPS
ncbi:MAG: signal peptidase II [Rhodothermales bacterium]|nr:signal peptidase II [Rhodothermales bacterium]